MTRNPESDAVIKAFLPTVWSELNEIPQHLDPKEDKGQIKYKFCYESDYFSFHPAMNITYGENKSLTILQMLIKIIDWNDELNPRNACDIQLCSHFNVAVSYFSLAARISPFEFWESINISQAQ